RLRAEERDAALAQPLGLLAERGARLVQRGGAVRLDADAERADRPAAQRALARRLACQRRGARVDLAHPLLEPELRELDPVRAERVGLDQLGARADVRAVHVLHELR